MPTPRIGRVFGEVTVIAKAMRPGYYVCRCSCGATTEGAWKALINGDKKSCGCLRAKKVSWARGVQPGDRGHPAFELWRGMVRRCHDATHTGFATYGGRGIYVCARWRDSFAVFVEDVWSSRPTPRHQLDRVNNDGPYSPENCRWALPDAQYVNSRGAITVTLNGTRVSRKAALVSLGISTGAVTNSVAKLGLEPWLEVALTVYRRRHAAEIQKGVAPCLTPSAEALLELAAGMGLAP